MDSAATLPQSDGKATDPPQGYFDAHVADGEARAAQRGLTFAEPHYPAEFGTWSLMGRLPTGWARTSISDLMGRDTTQHTKPTRPSPN